MAPKTSGLARKILRTWMGAARVVKGDRVLLDKAYGSANLEWGIANSSNTKFRIASVTKQFTATAIQLLDQQGKLDIDQPVKTYWPDAPARWDAITLRHLLDHTSGIKSITKHEEFGDWKLRNFDRDEMLRQVRISLPASVRRSGSSRTSIV